MVSILATKKSETTTNRQKIRVKWDKIDRELIEPELQRLASEELVEKLEFTLQNDLEKDCNLKRINTSKIVNFSFYFNDQQPFFQMKMPLEEHITTNQNESLHNFHENSFETKKAMTNISGDKEISPNGIFVSINGNSEKENNVNVSKSNNEKVNERPYHSKDESELNCTRIVQFILKESLDKSTSLGLKNLIFVINPVTDIILNENEVILIF